MTSQPTDATHNRSRQIAEVLARHGLGYLAGVLGLERLLPFQRGLFGHPRRAEPYTRPEHLRMALEELGAACIKLGQILSTRADLLPPEYQAELAKLQDAAPPVPPELIEAAVVAELGRPIAECFATFDLTPLAAASIGQAHAATLHDGTEVVVKVRRPGVVEQIEQDLTILLDLAATASRRWAVADRYDLVGLAQEFAQTLRAELDYIREGHSAERFAANFAGDPNVHIPRVFWEATTARVITLERIYGVKVDDLPGLAALGVDRAALAQRAARVVIKMILEDGFFHADQHPGNFFIEPGGRIGVIDFGMIGTVDEATQDRLARLVLAVAADDADQLVDALLDLGVARARIDRVGLRRDLDDLLGRYRGQALGQIAIGPLLEQALAIIRHHGLQLSANLVLLLKTVIMSEGMGAQLDPNFHLTAVLAPSAERLMQRQLAPARLARRLSQASLDAARLGMELPQQLRRLLGELERGGLVIRVQPEEFEPLMGRFERLANRIVLGMIAAAFIVGLAVLMAVYHPWNAAAWLGIFFAIGFAVVLALGAYLAWSIVRSGRGS